MHRKHTKCAENIPNAQKTYQMHRKHTKCTENIPNTQKTYQMHRKHAKCTENIPNGRTIDHMAIKIPTSSNAKTLQNLPKLGFLV
jgi:hypothetical protein